jgi:hypothetical protein
MLAVRNLSGSITSAYLNDPTNRWLPGLSNEEHHSLPAISSSAVKYFHKNSPQAFYRKYVLREFKEMGFRDEFRVGTLIHLAILEPEKFEKYVKICDSDQRTKDFKDYRRELIQTLNNRIKIKIDIIEPKQIENFEIENEKTCLPIKITDSELITDIKNLEIPSLEDDKPKDKVKKPRKYKDTGKEIVPVNEEPEEKVIMGKNGGYILENGEELFLVKSDEMAMYRAIQRNVQKHPRLSIMMDDCIIEQSGIAQCPRTGLFLSARGDARSVTHSCFIDPKSINTLNPHSISSAFGSYHYHIQHVHYLYVANLIEPDRYKFFYFLFISKENYEVCLTHLPREDIEYSWGLYFNLLDEIANCETSRKWKALDEGNVIPCSIPYWAKK